MTFSPKLKITGVAKEGCVNCRAYNNNNVGCWCWKMPMQLMMYLTMTTSKIL